MSAAARPERASTPERSFARACVVFHVKHCEPPRSLRRPAAPLAAHDQPRRRRDPRRSLARHILDSAQLVRFAPEERCAWVDLGAGAGFPAWCSRSSGGSRRQVHLVESTARKATFLREVARLDSCAGRRSTPPDRSRSAARGRRRHRARPCAPAAAARLAAPLSATGAAGLFLKGQDVETELTEAAKAWRIEAELMPSLDRRRGPIVLDHRAGRSVSASD